MLEDISPAALSPEEEVRAKTVEAQIDTVVPMLNDLRNKWQNIGGNLPDGTNLRVVNYHDDSIDSTGSSDTGAWFVDVDSMESRLRLRHPDLQAGGHFDTKTRIDIDVAHEVVAGMEPVYVSATLEERETIAKALTQAKAVFEATPSIGKTEKQKRVWKLFHRRHAA